MSNALVKQSNQQNSLGWNEMLSKADVLVKSGFLPKAIDTKEKAVAVWMMGDALGLHPMIAFQGIHIIAGKPSVAPELMLALIRRTGTLESFEYSDDGTCAIIKIKRQGSPLHVEKFSMADADKLTTTEWKWNDQAKKKLPETISLSQKQNWKEQPKVMRKWRAVSAACRLIFPDAVWGIASYTPDELGANVQYSEDGDVISVESVEVVDAPSLPPVDPVMPGDYENEQAFDEFKAIHDDGPVKHWSATDSTLDAKVQENFGLSRNEAEDMLGKTYAEFATRAEAGAAVKAAVEALKQDKPAAPKGKAKDAPKPWYATKDLEIWVGAHYGKTPAETLKDIKAKSWDTFATFQDAVNQIRSVAAVELWDARCETATYEAKDSKIHFETPIGKFTTWSREALVDAAQLAGQTNWEEVKEWTEGQHTLPDPIWLILEKKKDKIVIKEIRNAAIPF